MIFHNCLSPPINKIGRLKLPKKSIPTLSKPGRGNLTGYHLTLTAPPVVSTPTTSCAAPGSRTFVITSPVIAITNAQITFITCSFFPNASTTACASACIPRWISFGRNSKERHENNYRQDECEGDPCSAGEIDPRRNCKCTSEYRSHPHFTEPEVVRLPGIDCEIFRNKLVYPGRSQERSSSRTRSRACGTALPSDR